MCNVCTYFLKSESLHTKLITVVNSGEKRKKTRGLDLVVMVKGDFSAIWNTLICCSLLFFFFFLKENILMCYLDEKIF